MTEIITQQPRNRRLKTSKLKNLLRIIPHKQRKVAPSKMPCSFSSVILLLQVSLVLFVVLISLTNQSHQLSTHSVNDLQLCIAYPKRVNSMFLRGGSNVVSEPRLSWSQGVEVPAMKDTSNRYCVTLKYTSDRAQQTLQVKALIDDSDWSVGSNSFIVLPEQSGGTITIYPWFYNGQGTVERIFNIASPQLNNTRNLWVYLPPSYYENTLKVHSNVLVMHDGQNLFDPETAYGGVAWMCQDAIDQQVYAGNMEEVIVIGVDNTPDRMNELTYSYDASEGFGGKGDIYLNFVQQTVIPLIVKRYQDRIRIMRDKLGILGSSLGGLISCYAGWTRPAIYGRAGCMSSSFWWNNQDFNNTILRKEAPSHQVFYLDSGNTGPDNDDVVQTQTVRDHMSHIPNFLNRNALYYYLDDGGRHSEYYWGKRFHIPITKLYPVTAISSTNPFKQTKM